jgi:hypothetical protein
MAGGYATYGDWSDGISYFYMGEAGPGKAAQQLRHLRAFFEQVPFHELRPRGSFSLAAEPEHYVFYLPRGGKTRVDLSSARNRRLAARWFNPRSGDWKEGPEVKAGANEVAAPDGEDWVLWVQGKGQP